MVNIYIFHEINLWPFNFGKDFALINSLFGAVKLTTHTDPDNYKYSGYGIGFHARESFPLSNGTCSGKNVIIFGVDVTLPVHEDNKKGYLNCCQRSNASIRWCYDEYRSWVL